MKYGPNTEKIEQILTQIAILTPEQAQGLGYAWDDLCVDAWWDLYYETVWDEGLEWHNVQVAFQTATRGIFWEMASDGVWKATEGVILALFMQDKISQGKFDILYGPWKKVMGDE